MMIPFRFPRLALLLTSAWLVQSPAATSAQEAQAVFRSRVAVVPISAVVRDSRNRVVRDLGREDFHVLENSQPRPIVDFLSTDNAPLSLAVLFDTSGSMRGPNLDRGKAVVGGLLEALNPAADEVALFTFDKRLRQETPFTSDVLTVWESLTAAGPWGLTSLYDAIADTAKTLSDRPRTRRAVVVVTDGLDTSSSLTASQVSGIASAIDVPVYVVAVAPQRPVTTGTGNDGDLSTLAYWTGGDVARVGAGADTGRAVGQLMAELRQQYFLAIESATAAGWHRLVVTTTRPGLRVRARSGYFAASGAAGHGE